MSEQKAEMTAPEDAWTFEPRTELAKELWEIRRRIVASGIPLLDDEELEQEIASRRGGIDYGNDEADVP